MGTRLVVFSTTGGRGAKISLQCSSLRYGIGQPALSLLANDIGHGS